MDQQLPQENIYFILQEAKLDYYLLMLITEQIILQQEQQAYQLTLGITLLALMTAEAVQLLTME